MRDDLPEPVRPTTPQLVPGWRSNVRSRSTGGSPGRYEAVTLCVHVRLGGRGGTPQRGDVFWGCKTLTGRQCRQRPPRRPSLQSQGSNQQHTKQRHSSMHAAPFIAQPTRGRPAWRRRCAALLEPVCLFDGCCCCCYCILCASRATAMEQKIMKVQPENSTPSRLSGKCPPSVGYRI